MLQIGNKRQQNKEKPSMLTDTEKTIAIIGAGPAGLRSQLELLKRYGHRVRIYEELTTPGGTAGTAFLIIIYQRMYCFMRLIG